MKNREFYWDWLKHENQILASRGNFFLVAESMLLVAFATLWDDESMKRLFLLLGISVAGIIMSWIWLQVNVKHVCGTHKAIANKLNIMEPRWRNRKKSRATLLRQKPKFRILLPLNRTFIYVKKDKAAIGSYNLPRNHDILGIVMPLVVLILWVYLVILSVVM
ncbi:MAG: hypothetical protein IMF11_18675 [Proteobacteria bacterium]|nr:hypothetical protein [Pseudomonadota bacterium]